MWDSVVLICGVWLSSCVRWVGKGCGGIVGDGGVLPSGVRLVFVGKPTCFPHLSFECRLDCVHC